MGAGKSGGFDDSFANENYSHYDGGQKSPSIDY